ncbi:50S ribosomal protein L33 [Geobacillus jurassicus]|uniref:Large ribosomal subunit protein bL33 n=2 Tax=Geobacillus jurassicus TaxID=235932 RepID=A0ABV6GUF0_9BACL|nr:50S ribosomal protein L33 [Geobacillus jurassicus]
MRQKVMLACAQCRSRSYTATKPLGCLGERLTANKFCPICRKHTVHRETK